MRRDQVTQSTDQPQQVMDVMPMEIQHNTASFENAIVNMAFELQKLQEAVGNSRGPHPSNGLITQTSEAPPPSPRPTPCAQNVSTRLDYPTAGHPVAAQTCNELSVPDDLFADKGHFANTSFPVEPTSVAIYPKSTREGGIGKGKKKGKTGKKTKKDANEAENIMVDESSTVQGEPEIQYPEIQYTPADEPDLAQATRLEHQFTVHIRSPTMPSKVIIEF
jgi:hypothetical protein